MKSIYKSAIVLPFYLSAFLPLSAQPAPVKKVAQSVFSLTTFSKGNIVATTNGVFTANGEAMSMWHPFIGADSAVVVDAKGNKYAVDALLGANDIYDICKFKIKGKSVATPLAPKGQAAGNKLWIVDYSIKKPTAQAISVASTEVFMDSLTYYLFDDNDVSSTMLGCPIVNEQGQVLGIMQRPKNGGRAYSADARLSATFKLTALSLNDNTMRQSAIRTALPSSANDAMVTLMLASQRGDSLLYTSYINDFISAFPQLPDGYTAKAQQEMAGGNYAVAAKNMEIAIKNAERKDEAHSNYSKLIYQKMVYSTDSLYKDWTLDKALDEAQQAYAINPLPAYKHQQGQIVYAQGKYKEAYDIFMSLTNTTMRSGELFYEASQCQRQLKAADSTIIQLLDSAVAAQPKNLSAAPYILERGLAYYNMNKLRPAFFDFCAYDSLMNGRASHNFYYIKYQCENKMHLYQQALNDIAHAIVFNRNEPVYYAEMASLQLKVGQNDKAIQTTDLALQVTDQYSDIYIIRGIAFGEMKEKAKALEALKKAKELGDERADELIEKYK